MSNPSSRYCSRINSRLSVLEIRLRDLEARQLTHEVTSLHRPRVATVQRVVAEHYGLELSCMWSAARPAYMAGPRQIAIVLASQVAKEASTVICRVFGKKSAATVFHAITSVKDRCFTDPKYRAEFEVVKAKVVAALEAAA